MQTPETIMSQQHHERAYTVQEVLYGDRIILEQATEGATIDLLDDRQSFIDPLVRRSAMLQIIGIGSDGQEASIFLTQSSVIGQARGMDGSLQSHLEPRLPHTSFAETPSTIVIGGAWESPLGSLERISAVRKEMTGGPMGFEDHREGESPFIWAHKVEQKELKSAILRELPTAQTTEALSGEALLRIERNRALLESFEAGRDMVPAYEAALQADSRVSEVRITATTEHYGKALRDNTVELRLGDLHEVEDAYATLLGQAPAVRVEIAEQLGIPEGEVTPRTARLQSMLHEFGHVLDYMERGASLVSRQRAEEMETLPLGSIPASELLREDNPKRQELDRRYTPDEVATLISQQAHAYRRITAESVADRFAAEVLRTNPDLLKTAK